MNHMGLLGAGAQADEIKEYVEQQGSRVEFLAVNLEHWGDDHPLKIDILQPDEKQIKLPVIVAVGAPLVKKYLTEQWPGENYYRIAALHTWVSNFAEVGPGTVIAPNAAIGHNARLGRHVLVNLGATLSHDVVVEDYATISPGVHIGGRVTIGEGVFVGIGAIIKNDVKVAPGTVVGAGAVLLDDVMEENSVVVGVPAKTVRVRDSWLSEI